MQGKTRIAMLLSAAVVAIAAPTGAAAASYKDIAGTWCGSTTNYTFDRKTLRVFWRADRTSRTFRITDYDYGDDEITVHWRKDGETVFTTFNQLSGGNMVQKRTDNGPRREFHRC
jgi:hypothetical protein